MHKLHDHKKVEGEILARGLKSNVGPNASGAFLTSNNNNKKSSGKNSFVYIFHFRDLTGIQLNKSHAISCP